MVIDVPGESPIWVNQDGLTVIFHSEGDLPPDFLTYVLSKDGGDTWVEIGRRGPVAVALEENTTVEVLLREKDVFGELTPEELQARLVVHEDSLRPSAPELTQDVVVADISTRAGVLLATPSSDPGGGPVSYELFGGARDRFESVGEDPWFELPGIPLDEGTMFLVRAVDRAGNTSETRSVVVANNSLRQQADAGFGCRPWPCLWRVLPAVRDGKAVYRECWNCDHSPRYALFACAASPAGQAYCEQLGVLDRNPSSVDVFGRYVAYLSNDDPPDDGLVLEDLGPDERPGGEPGQGSTVLGGGARCPALASQGLVYVAGDGRLRLRTFGADGVHGTGDAGEGDVPLPVAATIPDRCRVRFNGRHVVWLEDADNEGFDVRLYDLGPDRQPGSPDDPAADATLIGTGYPQQETVAEEVLLDGQRLHALNRLLDAGPDGVFATGDDVSWELPGAHSLSGDKVLLGNRGDWLLYDVSTGESLGLRDDGYVSGTIDSAGLGGSLLFAMYVPSPGDGFPSSLGLLDPPLGFALPEPASAGAVSGGLAWLRRSGDVAERLVNLRSGGLWRPDPAESLDDWGEELDQDGGRLVYREGAGRILLFDAGADATPGTDDDVGPAEVAPAGRWPRLSGDVVVWADLAGDADGLWHGADLVSRIRGLRLGDDGLPGTADDEPLQVTDGGREVFPEVADGRVLWLDLRNDPDGRCPLDDKDQVDPAQCETDVFARTLPDGDERVLDDGPGPAVGLQADGELAVWLASSDGELWQPRVAAGDDAPTAAAEPASVLTGVATDGTRVGWWSDGPVVVDPGPDGRFGTADDRTLLEDVGDVPDEWGMPTRPTFPVADEHGGPFGRPRHRWFEGEVVLSEDHLYDLDLVAPDVRTSGAVDLPIPDGSPEGAVSSLEVPAPDYERVHDLRVDVVLEHPAPSELLVLLVSPSGDAALLYDGARPRGADPARTLTLETSPALLDHYREPLAGTWTLRVVDRAPGGEGVLRSWRLSHLP